MKSNIRATPIIGLMAAEFLSLLGNQVATVAIPILVLQFTNSPLVTGIASAGNIIPIILTSLRAQRRNRLKFWDCFPTLRSGRNDKLCLRKS